MTFFATRRRLVEEANKRLRLPIPDFALTDRKKIIDRLMQEPEILSYIEETAIAENTSTDALLKKARMYAAEIGPKFSPFFYFRFAYFLARGWLRLHFRVQALAADEPGFDAIKPDSTVIFVSNHRSNFDPLLITYMASRRSTVALSAGEWARLWPLHHFVRAAGGFVVDRDASDPLYRRVLAAYVRLAVASGLHQAFFPEGELSRDGKTGSPKLGFLNFYCRACSKNRDIVFIPAGINYDRIPEDRRLANAEGGFANPKASFLISTSLRYLFSVLTLPFRRRSRRYGNACVAFGTPVSLQDWLRQHDIDIAELEKPGRYSWLPAFADDLMRSCEQEVPALPVAVTALALCEDGLSESWSVPELKIRVGAIVQRLEVSGANLLLPDGADAAVGFALDLLAANNLVRHVGDGNYSIIASELSVLRHYANSIAHLDS